MQHASVVDDVRRATLERVVGDPQLCIEVEHAGFDREVRAWRYS
jgi:hypothetical protein